MDVVYFDNAASSWPKPPQVATVMSQAINDYAANPGRASHKMAVMASRVMFETRNNLARLFNIKNANDIFYTMNTTEALNLAIKGFVKPGDHVICSSIEHNSVRRPLEFLKKSMGIKVSYVPSNVQGELILDEIKSLIQPNTTLFICSHSSNLLGTLVPIDDISEIIEPYGIKLLVDGAQTAGTYPLDVIKSNIHMLAFPGHKGLLGPQGTGGLYVHPSIDLIPLLHGGTGSQSERIDQPIVRPDRYESGTQNTAGIAGLNEGVKFILNETVESIHEKEYALTQRLMAGLGQIEGLTILGVPMGVDKTGIVSFNLSNIDSSEIAFTLDRHYNIAVRSGFHCTPLAHEVAGTLQTGAVRASVSYFTTRDEVDLLIHAVNEINKQMK